MNPNRRSFAVFVLLALLGAARIGLASVTDLTEESLREVARIARAVSVVQPYLKDSEYIEYGLDIYRAARRYHVEPAVLIGIAQQETSFSNNLPEGAAGEIGICQIRKMWLKHPGFRAEFGRVSIRELHKPAKNFLFAAWILKGLKESVTKRTLPYWSYYNAVRFENRFKYFIAVNKYISILKKRETYFSERAVAGNLSPAPRVASTGRAYRSPSQAPAGQSSGQSPERTTPESNFEAVARLSPSVPPTSARKNEVPGDAAMRIALARWAPKKKTDLEPEIRGVKKDEPRWIPAAVAKLEQQQQAQIERRPNSENFASGRPDIKTDRDFNANLLRAGNILDVKDYLPRTGALQD